MMRCFLLLFLVCSVASVTDKEAELESKRKTVLEQLTRTRTVLVEGYHLVTRQIITDVYMYRSYRTVSVVFYPITRDVTDARFMFQAEELHLNNIGSCDPQSVIIQLRRNAYPAVNPDGYDFPKGFIDPALREDTYTIKLTSDGSSKVFSLTNPRPGSWYALVYKKWEDPRTQKVEQQGLVADCSTILYTDLQVKREENIELIDCYSGLIIDHEDIPALFKCMTIDSIEPISLNVTIRNTTNSEKVLVRIQAESLPSDEEFLLRCAFDPKLNNEQTIIFSGNPSSWHYINVTRISNASNYADCESYYYRTDTEETINNHTIFDLMRDDKGRFFTFDYGLPTTDVQDTTSVINITSDEIKSVRFNLNKFIDIGGNFVIEASLLMSLKYYMGYIREKKKSGLLGFTEGNQFMKAVICLDIGHTSTPLPSGHCKYNDRVEPALFVLNSTDSTSIHLRTVIPYPDSGAWFLTTRLFCDDSVCPCRTSHNGTKYYVDSEASDDDDSSEDLSGELSTNYTRQGVSYCNASVVLSLSSSSCLGGRCSNHGTCMYNTLGGMVMSFCSCSAGYGGWDCSDDSRMDSRMYMLVSVLLLTLSNMLFFMSIYVAVIRLYYTEAMMYTFTMVFSTFYHACDAPAQVAYCITRGNILQFGDFYCGIMCFWVTLLAMSILRDNGRASLQLVGAIIIALLTTWNMHSFLSFLVPVAVGIGVLGLSWYADWYKTRKFRYPKSYYIKHLPAGIVLVSVGLVCFAFLQTEQNYKIVHSVWHAIIALSVAFLLPDVRREGNLNPFLPSPNYCRLPLGRVFHRSAPPA